MPVKTPVSFVLIDNSRLDEHGVLRLVDCEKLEDSYIRLKYEVVN